MDKSSWPPGPWHSEPDELTFISSGYPCRIQRVEYSGHLCGYVSVPPTHPWFGLKYDAEVPTPPGLLESRVDVDRIGILNLFTAPRPGATVRLALCLLAHGGITYSREEEDGWTFGFDCAHAGDNTPWRQIFSDSIYRDFAYVKAEVESLARQLRHFHSVNDALAGA